ncbi:MAG: polysaccharide deacetylase family protein [Planctomycetia bacterium]|nr:polysaccharide deacetylase family protein [Planctomycetia bacterium]
MANFEIQSGTLLEDFGTIGDWTVDSGGTATEDTIKVKIGSKSVKVVTNAGENCAITKDINVDLSVDSGFYLQFYLDNDTNTDGFSFFITSTTSGAFTSYFKYSHSFPCHEGWNRIFIGKDQWSNTGAEDWANNMRRIRVRANSEAGVVGTIYFDGIYYNRYNRPKIVLIFDDINDTDYTEAYDFLKLFNIKATSALVSSYVGGANRLTLAQIQEMYDYGWDFVNHTVDHTNLTTLGTQEEMETKIGACKDWLEVNGFTRNDMHKLFVYPNSGTNSTARVALTAKGVMAARSNYNRTQPTPMDEPLLIAGNANPYPYTYQDTQDKIDRAIADGGTTFLYLHKLVATSAASTEFDIADFKTLIRYAVRKESQIDFMTFSEWYRGLTEPRKLV